jgi:glycosyltransferase involved in cell wall biosynthesis
MPERLRVLEMVYSFDVEMGGGGITRFTTDLARALDSGRFEISLCGLGNYGSAQGQERIRQLNDQGIRAYTATDWDEDKPYSSFARSLKFLAGELKLRPVDILHSHSEFTDIVALLLKMRGIIPKILRTRHNGHPLEWRKKPWRRILFTNILFPLYFDAEIGVSPAVVQGLNRRWLARFLSRQAHYLNNAVDLTRFSHLTCTPEEKKLALGVPADATVIGTIGRLGEEKGYSFLLDAAAITLQSLPNTVFMIVGDGKLANALRDQAQALGIAEQVLFTGSRPDVEELLSCMSVFVSSSLWEGLPSAILESMACGVPVVATDIPGTRFLIRHGENGWLVPPANAAKLAAGMLKLLESPSLGQAMASRSLEIVKDFSIERVARKHEALYEAIGSRK